MKLRKQLTKTLAALLLLASGQMAFAQTTVPANLAAPAGTVNTNIPGFKYHIVQAGVSRYPITSSAIAEDLVNGRAIDPTTGNPFDNLATPNTDGTFIYNIDTYINLHDQ